MDPFDMIPLNDIDEDSMTDLEKETVYDECLYDDALNEDENK